MTKNEELLRDIDSTLVLMLDVADDYISEVTEQLRVVENPEKLIGKDYATWDANDLAMLSQVYGQVEPNPLSNLIFNREYERVKELEAEEGR